MRNFVWKDIKAPREQIPGQDNERLIANIGTFPTVLPAVEGTVKGNKANKNDQSGEKVPFDYRRPGNGIFVLNATPEGTAMSMDPANFIQGQKSRKVHGNKAFH